MTIHQPTLVNELVIIMCLALMKLLFENASSASIIKGAGNTMAWFK